MQQSSSKNEPQLLRVCKIGKAQGLKGEVNVMNYSDSPFERYAPQSVLVQKNGTEFVVEKSRKFKQRWIVKFEGVNDRTASEALNGIVLYVDVAHSQYCEADDFSDDDSDDDSEVDSEVDTLLGENQAENADCTDHNIAAHDITDHTEEFLDTHFQSKENSDSDDTDFDDGYADFDDEGIYYDDLVGMKAYLEDGTFVGTVADVIDSPGQTLLEIKEPKGAFSLVPFVEAIVPEVDIDEEKIILDPPNGLLEELGQ